MKPKTDERRGLARETRKIRSALDDLAALAKPNRRPAAAVDPFVPPLMPTDSLAELCFDDLPDVPDTFPMAPAPAFQASHAPRYEPQSQSLTNLDDFFADLEVPADNGHDLMATDEISIEPFSPGTSEDLFEGFASESDIPAKSEQDTVVLAGRSDADPTPSEGYPILQVPEPPPATESINDLLDGFDW